MVARTTYDRSVGTGAAAALKRENAACIASAGGYSPRPMRSTSKMTTILLLAVLLIRPGLCAESATAPPKAPPRTYHNPLLPDIEIADPFVPRVDGKYYLYPTSDARGYEVFVSGGLVHWERSRTAEGGQ